MIARILPLRIRIRRTLQSEAIMKRRTKLLSSHKNVSQVFLGQKRRPRKISPRTKMSLKLSIKGLMLLILDRNSMKKLLIKSSKVF